MFQSHFANTNPSQEISYVLLEYSQPDTILAFQQESYNFSLQNSIQELFHNMQSMKNQIELLKNTLKDVSNEIKTLKERAPDSQEQPNYLLIREKSGKIVKEFTKHLSCPFERCRSKYSSRIALRAHLRRFHKHSRPQEQF